MSVVVCVAALLAGTGASYSDDGSRNLVGRDEPQSEKLELVQCPVCEDPGNWLFRREDCPIAMDSKRYKRCEYGTYVNAVCGGRLDCYRGPRERCTEKMENDLFGQKCAPGLFCNKVMGECTGINYSIDSNEQLIVYPHRYRLRDRRDTRAIQHIT